MKRMSHWSKPIALLAFVLSPVGSFEAAANIATHTTSGNTSLESASTASLKRENLQLAQGFLGECRAAARSTFIYSERSRAEPIRSLQADEKVTLAEENGRRGWIAISSPIAGFVNTEDLKLCSGEPVRPQPPPTSSANRCRRVIYEGPEGLTVRERPDKNSPRVGGVFFEDRVTLSNPPRFEVDSEGREWARITSPIAGWVSNGFGSTGEINLRACS